jgi:hypothetical protein
VKYVTSVERMFIERGVEQWADRVLDAPSLEAVFIGH